MIVVNVACVDCCLLSQGEKDSFQAINHAFDNDNHDNNNNNVVVVVVCFCCRRQCCGC